MQKKYQLRTIIQLLKDHPGIAIWNQGNMPDIFVFSSYERVGEIYASEDDLTEYYSFVLPKLDGVGVVGSIDWVLYGLSTMSVGSTTMLRILA